VAGLRCPCVSLKRGCANMALAASIFAQWQILFGGDFVPVVVAAFHGTASLLPVAALIGWAVLVAAGVFESLEGYRAAQSHRDPFNAEAVAWSLGVGLFCLYALYAGWSVPLTWGTLLVASSRCALLAGVAYNAAGLWLQIRGPVAALFVRLPRFDDPPPQEQYYEADSHWQEPPQQDSGAAAQLAEYREVIDGLAQEVEQHRRARVTWQGERVTWQEAVAERDRAISEIATERDRSAAERDHFAGEFVSVTAKCDRYLRSGKKMAAERRDIETVLRLPGVERALIKALHPDAHGGKSAAELRAFNDGFVKLTAIYERLKAGR
jgi:hypothetical protein